MLFEEKNSQNQLDVRKERQSRKRYMIVMDVVKKERLNFGNQIEILLKKVQLFTSDVGNTFISWPTPPPQGSCRTGFGGFN